MARRRSTAPGETEALGSALAAVLQPGDVVALVGDLGAGKTVLVRGLAAGLGFSGRVTSPTFAIVHHYEGPVELVHVDAWRLETSAELVAVGLEDVFASDRVTVIEWADRVAGVLPPDRLEIEISPGRAPEDRTIAVAAIGDAWVDRRTGVERVLAETIGASV